MTIGSVNDSIQSGVLRPGASQGERSVPRKPALPALAVDPGFASTVNLSEEPQDVLFLSGSQELKHRRSNTEPITPSDESSRHDSHWHVPHFIASWLPEHLTRKHESPAGFSGAKGAARQDEPAAPHRLKKPLKLFKQHSLPLDHEVPSVQPTENPKVTRSPESFLTAEQVDSGIARIAEWSHSTKQTRHIAETLEAMRQDAVLSFQQQGEIYQALQAHLSTLRKSLKFHQVESAKDILAPYLRHYKPRAGKFGKDGGSQVRSARELNTTDIKAALKQDMQTITPAYLHDIFDNLAPDIDPALARTVFQSMIQWSNPDSLMGLMEAMKTGQKAKAFNGRKLVPCGQATLSDSLRYLVGNANKPKPLHEFDKLFDPKKASFNALGHNGIILLDKQVLQLLQDDPDFFAQAMEKKNNHYFIVPRGWDAGANLFSLHDPRQVGRRLEGLCREVSKNEEQGLKRPDAIRAALEKPVWEQLISIFKQHADEFFTHCKTSNGLTYEEAITQILGPKRLAFLDNKRFAPLEDPTLEQLRKQLKQGPRLKKKDLNALMATLPDDQKQPFLELLGQGLQVFTPRRMSVEFRKLHGRITNLAHEKGIPDDQIYFYIPESPSSNKVSIKSHTLVTNQYCEVNNIPNSRIITRYDQLPQDKKTMMVILDDFSGSGHSLAAVGKRIQEQMRSGHDGHLAENLHVVISPNVASEETMKLLEKGGDFNMPRVVSFQDVNGKTRQIWSSRIEQYAPAPFITIMPGTLSPNLRKLPYYQKLAPLQKRLFDDLMGENGYAGCSTFTGFWWMSPTNNIRSQAAKQVLELNLLNQTGYR